MGERGCSWGARKYSFRARPFLSHHFPLPPDSRAAQYAGDSNEGDDLCVASVYEPMQ